MFGSKLRSWMENHIGRPRKKGNKNKNQNSNDGVKKGATIAATGFTIYHSDGTSTTTATVTTSSAALSTSITQHGNGGSGGGGGTSGSSSQHNVGGYHSSSSVISSPVRRREVSPIQSHSRYGWQSPENEVVTSPKSDNFLYAPQHHQHHHRLRSNHHNTAPNSKESSTADKGLNKPHTFPQHPDCSSSSISSLSWSTGSKEPSSVHSSATNHMGIIKPSQTTEQICPSASPSRFHNYSDHSKAIDDQKNEVHYEEIRTLLRHPDNMYNNNFIESDRPKSEQLSSFATKRVLSENNSQDDISTRYGRLLPSKIQMQSLGSVDSLNANHHFRIGSAESVSTNHNQMSTATVVHRLNSFGFGMNTNTSGQRHRIRTNRFSGPTLNPPQINNNAPAPIHSLSSPESAYSTGYSTDGTSPGAIYTPPEYYINMRTGTHYFPKSVNSLAIEAQRYKFGLNKIEEMSPIDPLPKTSFENTVADIPNYLITNDGNRAQSKAQIEVTKPLPHVVNLVNRSPQFIRNTIVLPTLKGFESPSPRQRCRIRTNPWYTTADIIQQNSAISNTNTQMHIHHQQQHLQNRNLYLPPTSTISSSTSSSKSNCSSTVMRMEVGSTSSASIKSSNDINKNKHNDKCNAYRTNSESSSSSLTEVENIQKTYTPNTIRRKRLDLMHPLSEPVATVNKGMLLYAQCMNSGREELPDDGMSFRDCQDTLLSDDDATLNEMMGKFDESYVYEKETDILSSDSDPTDCQSVDTGQEAEDECETDELLDIDFIDTSSVQDVHDCREALNNSGNCSYYPNSPAHNQNIEIKISMHTRRNSRSLRNSDDKHNGGSNAISGGSQRRRKRFMKTRKKSAENRGENYYSPRTNSRESRSVGGTPVCLRRNQAIKKVKECIYKTSPLSIRSSSLVFTDMRESRFMTIGESEKALLRADMEADIKYRQLIQEAESILVSLRNSTQSIPRETPVASPRRINPLANKRVEMLKNCDLEQKRQSLPKIQPNDTLSNQIDQELSAAINKRIELLKFETTSAPNSPKSNRCSLRKTHITNFINQNVPSDVAPRKQSSICESPKKIPQSPQLQLNGRRMKSSNFSPMSRRRFRSQSPKHTAPAIDSDSEQDFNSIKQTSSHSLNKPYQEKHKIGNISKQNSLKDDITNQNYLPDTRKVIVYDDKDIDNHNVFINQQNNLTPFDGGLNYSRDYCPQSEPLKRKVYKGSSSFDRIQKSFDLESEIPKQKMLSKINSIRMRERHQLTNANGLTKLSSSSAKSSSHDINHCENNDAIGSLGNTAATNKKQLMILSTIADLKRSLESQSVELNGLNED